MAEKKIVHSVLTSKPEKDGDRDAVRGGERNERKYSKNKRGLGSKKRENTVKTLTTGCILSVSFVLERMGGAHSE